MTVTDLVGAAANDVAADIRAERGDARAWTLGVGDPAAISTVVAEVAGRFGGIDILINNAGVAHAAKIDDDGYDAWWGLDLPILLAAHQRTVRATLPFLRRSSSPRVLNIGSKEALGATTLSTIYAVAKAGVTGLTRALAVELGREVITVNCICPGPILSGMTASVPDDRKTMIARTRTELCRWGDPAEVAHTALSLCLPAASFITGAVILVDGGLMARTPNSSDRWVARNHAGRLFGARRRDIAAEQPPCGA